MTEACKLITVIGRGHSGTRAISHTLSASGVYMGAELNGAGDLLPPASMYEACRLMARYVRHLGGLKWDFSALHTMPIDPEFEQRIGEYLRSVLGSDAPVKGWKIPETTLVFPWIARMFPDAYYIRWTRDPRDSILGGHLTDNLADFAVPYDPTDEPFRRRAISWKYQVEIVKATPPPKRTIAIRFEDFVLNQDAVLQRLEEFLGMPLARIPVRTDSIGRWKTNPAADHAFDIFNEELASYA